jgi:hypothetical protein
MSANQPITDQMKAAAERVIQIFRENNLAELTLDLDGVRWIDGYINRVRHDFPVGKREGLIAYLAAFVGECIVQTFGGTWIEDSEGRICVRVSDRMSACPLAKIEKQFNNGESDSVFSFVTVIPTLEKHFASERPAE